MKSNILINFFEKEGGEEKFYNYLKNMFLGLFEFFKNYILLIYLLLIMLIGLIHELILIIRDKFTKIDSKKTKFRQKLDKN